MLLACAVSALAQNPTLKPFYHGVASGDALSDRVIIWTRITPDSAQVANPISVDWLMATDTFFNNVVSSGTATTDSSKDFTVKVDVTGLEDDTWYYYIFKHDTANSLIGRTKTLPTGDNSRIRMAVASCSSIGPGEYFNAYINIIARNDIQAVLHLGDYIYEYAGGGINGNLVPILPNTETTTLAKYRLRYNTYRLDPFLMKLHQQYPFYTVWDDHETANNAYKDGAENHTEGAEGVWQERKVAGMRANFEWLPKREGTGAAKYKNYKTFSIGDLADLIFLDTRLEGRDEQVGATNVAGMQDPNRTLLGTTQMNWFINELSSSDAKWKIVAQQVMIAPLRVLGAYVNADQWDGYQADRNKVINHVLDNNIENVVVLTGDIHTSWANDVPGPGSYDPNTGAGSAFVEFVTPGITSGVEGIGGIASLVQSSNPHVKYVDLAKHGYIVLDINKNRVQADWVYVSEINNSVYTPSEDASWYVNDGERFLREANGPSTGFVNNAPFAPFKLDTTGTVGIKVIGNTLNNIVVYPNPFEHSISIRVNNSPEQNLTARVYDMLGKLVSETRLTPFSTTALNLPDLRNGTYLLSVTAGKEEFRTTIIKSR